MAINGKKIPAVPTWNGDQSMRIHAAKPGVSEAVSISEIVALASSGSGLAVGDVVLRPSYGMYEGLVPLDGSAVLDPSEHVELGNQFGHGPGFTPGAQIQHGFGSGQVLYQVEMLNGAYIFSFANSYVYSGSSTYTVQKGAQSNLHTSIFLTKNAAYGIRYEAGIAKIIRFGETGYTALALDLDASALEYALSTHTFFIESLGSKDVLFYPDAGIYKLIDGNSVTNLSVGASITNGRFSGFSASASNGARVFFSAYDSQIYMKCIAELALSGSTYELVTRASGVLDGALACNSDYIVVASRYVRGTQYPEIQRYSLTNFNAVSIPEFLNETAEDLVLTSKAVYLRSGGYVYEANIENLEFTRQYVNEESFYMRALFVSESVRVVASDTAYITSVAVEKVSLPVVPSPSPSLKYFIKI